MLPLMCQVPIGKTTFQTKVVDTIPVLAVLVHVSVSKRQCFVRFK